MKRKKLLAMALSTAVLATIALPSAFATTGGSSTSTVTVTEDTTLTISLGSDVSSIAFTVAEGTSQVTASNTYGEGEGQITVQDHTGDAANKNGHHFKIAFDDTTWAYSGDDANYSDTVAVDVDTPTTTSNDEISFYFIGKSKSSFTFTANDANVCDLTDGEFDADIEDMLQVTSTSTTWGYTTETCPGTYVYENRSPNFVGGNNGLGNGTYTQTATVTLFDGQEQ